MRPVRRPNRFLGVSSSSLERRRARGCSDLFRKCCRFCRSRVFLLLGLGQIHGGGLPEMKCVAATSSLVCKPPSTAFPGLFRRSLLLELPHLCPMARDEKAISRLSLGTSSCYVVSTTTMELHLLCSSKFQKEVDFLVLAHVMFCSQLFMCGTGFVDFRSGQRLEWTLLGSDGRTKAWSLLLRMSPSGWSAVPWTVLRLKSPMISVLLVSRCRFLASSDSTETERLFIDTTPKPSFEHFLRNVFRPLLF
ncbi:hypothetical protein F2Q68_00011355 [Brassica cretica]|uniref:Uncharacterized protein n=1 Tax=Brassica cretica TaxID=69181 RepID=A0A8S9KQH9_BRACR|nr:hypothetical protein F2Q68_00011355 [Brassica cretica]